MTLNELKGKYARLSSEIDTLAAEGVRHEARLMRLMNDLDQVHRDSAICACVPSLRPRCMKP